MNSKRILRMKCVQVRWVIMMVLNVFLVLSWVETGMAQLNDNDKKVIKHAKEVWETTGWGGDRSVQDSFAANAATIACAGVAINLANTIIYTDGLTSSGFQNLPEGTAVRTVTAPLVGPTGHTFALVSVPDPNAPGGYRHWMVEDYLGFLQMEEMVETPVYDYHDHEYITGYRFKDPGSRLTDRLNGQPLGTWSVFGRGLWSVNTTGGTYTNKIKVNGEWVDIPEGQGLPGKPAQGIPENNETGINVSVRFAFDPNLKVGPDGFGEQRYVKSKDMPLYKYTVYFENQPSATAPAHTVQITDTLDPTLSFADFEIGTITIEVPDPSNPTKLISKSASVLPGTNWTTKYIDLRPERYAVAKVVVTSDSNSRTVYWVFTTLDPSTCDAYDCMQEANLSDPNSGFLMPGAGGSVVLKVPPSETVTHGTEVTNLASILFDSNEPMLTNTWVNTIDDSAPSSQVEPLAPTQSTSSFTVHWNATDSGSGVKAYSIYVSDDGGQTYWEWLSYVFTTEEIFPGLDGRTYLFYSIAWDQVGNVEEAPLTADAMTAVAVVPDQDGDGIPDAIDNCPSVSNPDQADADGDGVGNACDGCPNDEAKSAPGLCGCGVADTDTDSDGTPNCNDACPTDPAKVAPGTCGCGVADTDSDGDGVPNCNDGCPDDPNKTAPGACGCGKPDAAEICGDGIDNDCDGKIDEGCNVPGDLDKDGDVDRDDVNILLTFRNKPASACPECDIDGDNKITVLDSRKLVLTCTRPGCATK